VVENRLENQSARVADLESILHGNGRMGMKTRVLIMWHSYTWLWGVCGLVAGWVLHGLVK